MVKRKTRDRNSKDKHWAKMVKRKHWTKMEKRKTRDKNSKEKNTGQKW